MTTKIPVELSSTPGIVDGSNATAITIDSSENVGIGTSSPTGKIHVAGSPPATNGGLVFVRNSDAASNNTTFGGIHFSSSPGTDFSIGKANVNAATTLSFRNGNTGASYMDIDSSGNVGIGYSSPSDNIHILGNDSTPNVGITLQTDDTANAQASITLMSRNSANTNVSATLKNVTTALQSSLGITFGSDTAAANALDDYEEGVHVATVTPSTSGTCTLAGAYSDLSYTKIGRLVTVTGLLIVSSVSSPVGYYSISLPFTPGNLTDRAADSAGTIIHHQGNNAGAGQYIAMINELHANILIYRGDVGVTRSETSAQELTAGTQLNLSVTYVTA